MGEGDFAWLGQAASAYESCVGDGVVRRSEGPVRYQGMRRGQHASDTVYLGYLQGLLVGHGRQDSGHGPGQQSLPSTGRADQEQVVGPGSRHFQGALGMVLSSHIADVNVGAAGSVVAPWFLGHVLLAAEDRQLQLAS